MEHPLGLSIAERFYHLHMITHGVINVKYYHEDVSIAYLYPNGKERVDFLIFVNYLVDKFFVNIILSTVSLTMRQELKAPILDAC